MLKRTIVIALFVLWVGSCLPCLAQICSLPPSKVDTNPYSRQSTGYNPYSWWKNDSHTYNPYSSTPGSDENVFHEHMQETDEPGYWVVKTYPVNGWGNTNLTFDAHVDALTDDGRGTPNNWGQYLELKNRNEAPIYFNYTTHVLNDKLMPGESRRIQLGIYQPKGKAPIAYTVPLTIKYWVKTGNAPIRCKTWAEFYSGAVANGPAHWDAVKKYVQFSAYTVNFPGGKTGSFSQFVGPVRLTLSYTSSASSWSWQNTGNTAALWYCDPHKIHTTMSGSTETGPSDQNPKGNGWHPLTATCYAAVAPPDSPTNPYLK